MLITDFCDRLRQARENVTSAERLHDAVWPSRIDAYGVGSTSFAKFWFPIDTTVNSRGTLHTRSCVRFLEEIEPDAVTPSRIGTYGTLDRPEELAQNRMGNKRSSPWCPAGIRDDRSAIKLQPS